MEGEIDNFWDSVEMMFFVYALAAVVSLAVAWVIKLIFAAIQMRKARAEARAVAAPDRAD